MAKKSLTGKQYALACGMKKINDNNLTNSLTLHVVTANSKEEAKGIAIEQAMIVKPGFLFMKFFAFLLRNK